MIEVDHSEGIEYTTSQFLSGITENLENDSDIVEYLFMKKQPEILENDAHGASEFVNFVVGNA
jgi:hypothetical protein